MDDLQLRHDALAIENAKLRLRLAAITAAIHPPAMLQPIFGLTVTEDRFVTCLLNGDVLTKAQIHAALYADDLEGGPGMKIIDVMACNIRMKLAKFGIGFETLWGRGYRMSQSDQQKLRALCGQTHERAA